MVITKDFESFDPGSSPGRTFVPVAQLDKASDYESEDWGFKSLQGYVLLLHKVCKTILRVHSGRRSVPCLDARGV